MMDWQRDLSQAEALGAFRRTPFWVVALLGVALPMALFTTGCSTLNFLRSSSRSEEKIDDRIPRPGENGNRRSDTPSLPGQYSFRLAPYVFLSDFKISADQPLFQELAQLRDQVYKELLLPSGTAVVQVYLFETRESYRAYMNFKHPELPERRAFFIAQPRGLAGEDLIVYTYWSDRIRKDLRHELTHALLHSVIRDVPLWLDEGLAEYFELPPEKKCINAEHIDLLRRALASGAYKPNLARLEGLKQVDEMNPAEYREAYAWVHLLLHSDREAKTTLLSYIQQLRGSRTPGALGPKLEAVFPDLNKSFRNHVTGLDSQLSHTRDAAPRVVSK